MLHIAAFPPTGFFSGDQGAKYLQARAIADQGPFKPWIIGPAPELDPKHRYIHAGLFFNGQHVVSWYTWMLPMLAAPFLAVLGLRGLYVVPALSALVVFLVAARLGRAAGAGEGALTGWAAIVATPIMFYACEFWEHAPAAAAVVVAADLLGPHRPTTIRRFAAAGVTLSVGALLREEVLIAAGALLIARVYVLGVNKQDLASVAAMTGAIGAVMALIVPINKVIYGTPIPFHAVSEFSNAGWSVAVRGAALRELLLPSSHVPIFVTILTLVSVFSIWKAPIRAQMVIAHLSVAALAVICVIVPLSRIVNGVPTAYAFSVTSLAHTWPFAIVLVYSALLPRIGSAPVIRFLVVVSVMLIAAAVGSMPTIGGAQWGPRYCLLAAPLLAVVASSTLRRTFALSRVRANTVCWAARGVMALSVTMQVLGMLYLYEHKQRNAALVRTTEQLAPPGDVVVSDLFWYPQLIEALYSSRHLLFAWSPAQVGEVFSLAARAGITRVALVVSTPITGYIPPDRFDGNGQCVFTRVGKADMFDRALLLHRYVCAPPASGKN